MFLYFGLSVLIFELIVVFKSTKEEYLSLDITIHV